MHRQSLESDLQFRQLHALYRSRRVAETPCGTDIEVDGKQLLSFCSNDYLGLANHPALKKAFVRAVEEWGVGSGSAHLVTGHSRAHHELEEALAEFTGRESALLFSSGYMANLALITTFASKDDHVFEDKLNHASLIDAGRLSAARLHRYLHADTASLQRQLQSINNGDCLIATDGVFSMDGDVAPLAALVDLAEQYSAKLMVDDAHGIGVLGQTGAGTLESLGLNARQVPLLMGTLGKAFGTAGAFIAGDKVFIETLIQKARSYIFTTAQPAAIAAATLASLQLVRKEDWRREKLQSLITRFKDGSRQLGLPVPASDTPIQPLLAGKSAQAVGWARQLEQQGILVSAIRPPTVPQDTARLRITFSANHSEKQVDQLLDALASLKGIG